MLEGALITWTKQIKAVLKLDPEQILQADEEAGPLAEIQFWEDKANNL
jgi:dynein heavy chain